MKVPAFLLSATLALGFAGQACAITPQWSSVAAACQPDSASAMRLAVRNGRVSYSSTSLDPINLICEIEASINSGQQWDLALTYQDSTGVNPSAVVTAKLMAMNRATGGSAAIATFTSNGSATATVTRGLQGFSHVFNFNANYYYVLITLDRSLTSETVQALGVSIDPFIP